MKRYRFAVWQRRDGRYVIAQYDTESLEVVWMHSYISADSFIEDVRAIKTCYINPLADYAECCDSWLDEFDGHNPKLSHITRGCGGWWHIGAGGIPDDTPLTLDMLDSGAPFTIIGR